MERAVEWLFSHPDDEGSIPEVSFSNSEAKPSTALGKFGDRELPARYKLRAFISHKGPSVHSGHYVSHVRYDRPPGDQDFEWVFFNDEKVTKADEGPLSANALAPYVHFI